MNDNNYLDNLLALCLFAQVKLGNQSNPHFKIVNDDVYPYQLLIFINPIMRYLVSLDQNN